MSKKIEDMTIEEQATLLTMEELLVIRAEHEKRDRLARKWACRDCGLTMGYEYIMEGLFDRDGCPGCGGVYAIELREATSE